MHNLFIALKFKRSTKYTLSKVRKQAENIRSYGTQINKIIASKKNIPTDILIDDITAECTKLFSSMLASTQS